MFFTPDPSPVAIKRDIVKLGIDQIWRLILEAKRLNEAAELPLNRIGLGIGMDGIPLSHPSDLPRAILSRTPEGIWQTAMLLDSIDQSLFDLYLPFCRPVADRSVTIAHLGQSLDGRIATETGASYYVTGPENITHLHRMRALADAVVVGAGTVRSDNPSLTTRRVAGTNPVRVIIDAARRLGRNYKVFQDGETATLLLCDASLVSKSSDRHGQAEIIGIPTRHGRLQPAAIVQSLRDRGLRRIFVEGGGITVSRFLEHWIHRAHLWQAHLQIAVAPLIMGSGRPSITLPMIEDLSSALRPRCRVITMGADVLFDCQLKPAPH